MSELELQIKGDQTQILNIDEEVKKLDQQEQQKDLLENMQQQQEQADFMARQKELFAGTDKSQRKKVHDRLKAFKEQPGRKMGVNVATVSTSVLANDYRESYEEKKLYKSREKKIKNQKSRLYKKDRNAKALETYDQTRFEERNEEARLRRTIPDELKKEMSIQGLKDLSVLSTLLDEKKEKKEKNKEADFFNLVRDYYGIGTKKDNQGNIERKSEEETARARSELMTDLAEKILQFDVSASNLTDDEYVAQNARKFTRMEQMVDIYRRMSEENPGFELNLEKGVKERLAQTMTRAKDACAFYKVRKMIIENPYYRTHYNEELSINAKATDSAEKRLLSKLLRTAYYLGKNLQANSFALTESGGSTSVTGATEAMKLGDTSIRRTTLRNGDDDFMKEAEGKICQISSDKKDYENISSPELLKLWEKQSKLKIGEERKARQIEKQINEEKERLLNGTTFRERRDALLKELEREHSFLPPKELQIDLSSVGKQELTKDKMLFAGIGKNNSYQALTRAMFLNEERRGLRGKLTRIMHGKIGGEDATLGIKDSKRLGTIDLSDKVARMVDVFSGPYTEYLPEEEILEMFENLNRNLYQEYAGNRDEKTEHMLDESFLEGAKQFMTLNYRMLQQIVCGVGDKFTFMAPEDILRSMTPLMGELMTGGPLATMGNMTQQGGPEKFLHYAGEEFSYMKDFQELYQLVGSAGMISPLAEGELLEMYAAAQEDEVNDYVATRRTALDAEIKQLESELFKEGVSAEDKKAYINGFPGLSERKAEAKEAEILKEGLDKKKDKVLDLEKRYRTALAKKDMQPIRLYTLEKGDLNDLRKKKFVEADDYGNVSDPTYLKDNERSVEGAKGVYPNVGCGVPMLKSTAPKLAERHLTSEAEKQKYLNSIGGGKWNPYKDHRAEIDEDAKQQGDAALRSLNEKRTKWEAELREQDQKYREYLNNKNK